MKKIIFLCFSFSIGCGHLDKHSDFIYYKKDVAGNQIAAGDNSCLVDTSSDGTPDLEVFGYRPMNGSDSVNLYYFKNESFVVKNFSGSDMSISVSLIKDYIKGRVISVNCTSNGPSYYSYQFWADTSGDGRPDVMYDGRMPDAENIIKVGDTAFLIKHLENQQKKVFHYKKWIQHN
jgi:hypothetical protein